MFPLYIGFAPDVLSAIAYVGAFTALFSATIACVQTDIKRVLAFSTISQIGFMAAFKSGFYLLVFIALVNTVISLYYYLLVVKAMYINKNENPIATFKSDNYTKVSLAICLIGIVGLGLASIVYETINAFSYGL